MNRREIIAGMAALAGVGASAGSAAAQAYTPLFEPHVVMLRRPLPAGQVHVFPDHFRLYWTLPEQQAWVYPIRVGRAGLYEPGQFFIGAKKEWPSWKPTPDMVERDPASYARYAEDGMEGGPDNPLGARALYLFQEGRGDTFLRIHGTSDPNTIGRAVSNGCAGLINDHIVQLYEQVPMNTPVVLYPKMVPGVYPPAATS